MPKGIPKNGVNRGWFTNEPRPDKKTGIFKVCKCGKNFYCEKGKINRKKYCSVKCRCGFHPKGSKRDLEFCLKMSKLHRGKIVSKETREKISIAGIGRKPTKESIEKNRLSQIRRWDRIGRKEYKRYFHLCGIKEYKDWRMGVFVRDNFMCSLADKYCFGMLQAHHIFKWSDYPKLRYQLNNGITLCHAHHPRKWSEEKRLAPIFLRLVSVSKELQF